LFIYREHGEIPVGEAKKFFYLVGDEKETKRPGLYILKKNSSHTMDYVPISKPKLDWNSHTGKIRCAMHDGMYDPKTERPFIGMPKDPLKKIEPHKYFFKRYISKIMYIQAV